MWSFYVEPFSLARTFCVSALELFFVNKKNTLILSCWQKFTQVKLSSGEEARSNRLFLANSNVLMNLSKTTCRVICVRSENINFRALGRLSPAQNVYRKLFFQRFSTSSQMIFWLLLQIFNFFLAIRFFHSCLCLMFIPFCGVSNLFSLCSRQELLLPVVNPIDWTQDY